MAFGESGLFGFMRRGRRINERCANRSRNLQGGFKMLLKRLGNRYPRGGILRVGVPAVDPRFDMRCLTSTNLDNAVNWHVTEKGVTVSSGWIDVPDVPRGRGTSVRTEDGRVGIVVGYDDCGTPITCHEQEFYDVCRRFDEGRGRGGSENCTGSVIAA